jgi:hypothetical protein
MYGGSYLEPWAASGQLCCRRAGEVFAASPEKVAKQRDFYRLRDLTSHDVRFVQMLAIDPSPEHLKPLHVNLLKTFAVIPRLKALADAASLEDTAAQAALEEAVNNAEELLHGEIEDSAIGYLRSMLNGDTGFYQDDKEVTGFFFFLCVQCMRTKRGRETTMAAAAKSGLPPNLQFNLDRAWNVLSHIFATNMGWSLYTRRRISRLVLLTNETAIPLITGDQPIINTLANKDGTPPNELELYYPLSPGLGMLLTQRLEIYRNDRGAMTLADVKHYNGLIVSAAHEQIFSDSWVMMESLRLPCESR